jgi:hypothetical protein
MIRLFGATLAIGLMLNAAAVAGPIDDVVEQAKALAGTHGQQQTSPAVAAIDTSRAATIQALSDAPLGFRRILFVTAEPEGFAIYDPRKSNVFLPGEPLIVYTEPIGVTWKQADGTYSSKLMIDFEIKTPDGKTITGQKDFGQFTLAAKEPAIDYMTQMKFNLNGAPQGSYILDLTVRDTNSDKTATAQLPFEIK